MARTLRPLAAALAVLALALPATASASTPYDPDGISFGTRPGADLNLNVAGIYTFDTNTGAITGPGPTTIRNPGTVSSTPSLDSNIGVVRVQTTSTDTAEWIVHSLTLASGATIQPVGSRNMVIATYGDLDIEGSVNADGLAGASGGGFGDGDHPISPTCGGAGGGGSFGGFGGAGGDGTPSGGMYGTVNMSQELFAGSGGGDAASGCGSVYGGNAGGGVGLVALGSLTVNGPVSANGKAPNGPDPLTDQGGPGGGSGGGVLLIAPHLTVANQSLLSAQGGHGGDTSLAGANGGGGGGGGRLSLVSDAASSVFGLLAVTGGLGGSPGAGGAGGGEGNGGSMQADPFLTVAGPSQRTVGQAATFSATQAAGDSSLAWDFGDGSASSASPTHTYTTPGTYNVTVTATLTDSGQTATAQRSITIHPAPTPPGGGGSGGSGGGGGGGGTPPPPVVHCVVPKLKGLSLGAARKRLAAAHCKLGKVKKPKLRKRSHKRTSLVVTRQAPANATLPAGTAVNVTLGPKKKSRKRRHH